jgi:hypothetical protein
VTILSADCTYEGKSLRYTRYDMIVRELCIRRPVKNYEMFNNDMENKTGK